MSFTSVYELPRFDEEIPQKCEGCKFTPCEVGVCIKEDYSQKDFKDLTLLERSEYDFALNEIFEVAGLGNVNNEFTLLNGKFQHCISIDQLYVKKMLKMLPDDVSVEVLSHPNGKKHIKYVIFNGGINPLNMLNLFWEMVE